MFQLNGKIESFSQQFSQQLESLRGMSAIVVLFSHCFQAFVAPFDASIYSFVRLLGQAGVMMFFALSGYLIGHSLQKINFNIQDLIFNTMLDSVVSVSYHLLFLA